MRKALGIGGAIGLLSALVLGGGCGGEGRSTGDAEVRVSASPLQERTDVVHFYFLGEAIGRGPFAEASVGGRGSVPGGGTSQAVFRLPEGEARAAATGLDQIDLVPLAPYGLGIYSSGPAYLDVPRYLYYYVDRCESAPFQVYGGRRTSVPVACGTPIPGGWQVGIGAAGLIVPLYYELPAVTRYLVHSGYDFLSTDRFAGSDGSNLTMVVFGDLYPGQEVDIDWEWGDSGTSPIGCFTDDAGSSPLPDPVTDGTDVWPAPATWPTSCTAIVSPSGFGWVALVAKPGAISYQFTPELVLTDPTAGVLGSQWVFVRVGGVGQVAAEAE